MDQFNFYFGEKITLLTLICRFCSNFCENHVFVLENMFYICKRIIFMFKEELLDKIDVNYI